MFKYFKLKRQKLEIEMEIANAIYPLFKENKKYIELFKNLADLPKEDLQKELVNTISELVHNENKDKNNE